MKDLGYYDGRIGPLSEMSVPMTDRALYFGDGVYDAACARNRVIYALDEHIDRLFRGAGEIGLRVPMAKEELASLLRDLSSRVDDPGQLVYWQLSRGAAQRTHAFPPEGVKPSLLATVTPFHPADPSLPLSVITAEDLRHHRCDVKTLNLLPNVLAFQRAAEQGCQEVVFHRGGRVTECARSNVHILRGGVLKTAPADRWVLRGVERGHLLSACAALGVPVWEEPYSLAELMEADEVIITSTGDLAARVERVDGKPVGGRAPELLGALQAQVQARFLRETGG